MDSAFADPHFGHLAGIRLRSVFVSLISVIYLYCDDLQSPQLRGNPKPRRFHSRVAYCLSNTRVCRTATTSVVTVRIIIKWGETGKVKAGRSTWLFSFSPVD